ncbi:MAG: phage terminase large subunit [Clostridia bacterium]|nr:phage terminase large subunit [Clostridia bacterium]
MSTIDLSQLSDKQYRFLSADAMHVGFGGARGGGKSWAVRTKAKILATYYKGIKVLIVRRTYPELINNHINPLRDELYGLAGYNKSEKVFTFSNGSTIKFGYCNNDKDLDQYQGAEYDVIFLDEATQLQEMWIKKIIACVRGVNSFPKRVYYTCNPGGVSHGYFKRLFIDKKYEEGENPEDYVFIQALVTDNKALMLAQPDYIKQLEALPPKIRDAWLYGRWDIYEGQVFEDFRDTPDLDLCHKAGITPEEAMEQRRFTHVIQPFNIPRHWNMMRSYDFGYNRPWSLGYWAIDPDGVLYRIMDVYGWNGTPNEGNKWTPDEQFKYIAELERSHPWLQGRRFVDSVADPAIWDASRGESVAETAQRYGIHFTPGENARVAGLMQVHYRLQFDENGFPRMYFFSNCATARRTLPLMMYSQTKPEDVDTESEDHCYDEIKYMCASKPVKPIVPKEQTFILSDPLNQFTNNKDVLVRGY